MNERAYGILLATILAAISLVGNLFGPREHLSAFPWAIAVLAFPVVLYPAMRSIGARRRGPELTERDAREIGLAVTRTAALAFGGFVVAFGFFFFEMWQAPVQIWLVLVVGGGMTLMATYALGWVTTRLCAGSVARRLAAARRAGGG